MNEPTIPAKVALQGNRITLAASEYINEENISNKDFQLLNEQGKVLEIDRIKVSANEIEIFPKERILKDSGEKFTINYFTRYDRRLGRIVNGRISWNRI